MNTLSEYDFTLYFIEIFWLFVVIPYMIQYKIDYKNVISFVKNK